VTFLQKLASLRREKRSLLCAGIDPDAEKIPHTLREQDDFIFTFCRDIIEATAPHAIAFKFNFAFFEALGAQGWQTLERLRRVVPPGCLTIADAKRGDIGNSARHYARAIFDRLEFDAVTVNPYMGYDASEPFLSYSQKGIFFLCLTSNPGAADLQFYPDPERPLYRRVAELVAGWNRHNNCGLVAGATKPAQLAEIRRLAPRLPLLIPGIGAQGGRVAETLQAVGDSNVLISASRSILYASDSADYARAAAKAAETLQREMQEAHK